MTATILALLLSLSSQGKEPLELSTASQRVNLKYGTPVIVTVTLKNKSDAEVPTLTAGRNAAQVTYMLLVKNAEGIEPHLTKYGEALHGHSSSQRLFTSYKVIRMKPREGIAENIDLNSIYVLTPDTYQIVAKKQPNIPEVYPHGTISSNTLTVMITK